MGKRTNTAQWLETQQRWQIKVQKDGLRRTFTSSTKGRAGQREANAKADAWLDDGIEKQGIKVLSLLPTFLEDVKVRTSSGNYRNLEYQARTWIAPQIGRIKINALNDQHLQSIINTAYKAGLSKKSLTTLRATLVSFIKFCRKCKATTFHPEDIIIPQGAAVKQKRILQPQDMAVLFNTDTTILNGEQVFDDLIYAYRLQVLTGLRPSELLGLMWSDIQGDILTVQRGINIRGEITQGKNINAKRGIALSSLAKAAIEGQRAQNLKALYIFPMKEQHYAKRLKKYCAANGITQVTPYEMRHTFVSIAKSLPEGEVKSLVGHSKSMDTFGTYGHAVNGEAQQTASKLDVIFTEILTSGL